MVVLPQSHLMDLSEQTLPRVAFILKSRWGLSAKVVEHQLDYCYVSAPMLERLTQASAKSRGCIQPKAETERPFSDTVRVLLNRLVNARPIDIMADWAAYLSEAPS